MTGSTGGLPTRLDDPRIGIADGDLAKLVASALSMAIAGNDEPRGMRVYLVTRGLEGYAVTPVGQNGARSEAPHPNLQPGRARLGEAVRKQLGLSWEDLKKQWQLLCANEGAEAAFDVQFICEFFRPELWRVVASMINDGPALATERLKAYLEIYAQKEVPATRARPEGGKRAKATTAAQGGRIRGFMRGLCELRWGHSAAEKWLGAWTDLPKIKLPSAEIAATDTIAPPRHRARLGWQRLAGDAYRRLTRDDNLSDEAAATALLGLDDAGDRLRAMRPKRLSDTGLFLRLRNLVLLTLVLVTGVRESGVLGMNRGHYDPRRQLPDGSRGPAVLITPKRTRANDGRPRWKPIPRGLAQLIDLYLLYLELRDGAPMKPADPLFRADLVSKRRLAVSSMQRIFSGSEGRTKALIPKDPGHVYYGHAPHQVRSCCAQMILSHEAQDWLRENRVGLHPISIAEALLDHEDMKLDSLGYLGAKKPADRERLSAIGAELNWLLLTTRRGARKQPDADAYRELLQRRKTREAELDKWSKDRRGARDKAGRRIKAGDITGAFAANVEADRAADQETEMLMQMAEIAGELKELKLNPDRLIDIDDAIETEDIEAVDLEEIELEFNLGLPTRRIRALKPIRSWLAPNEIGEHLGVSPAQMRRYLSEGVSPRTKIKPFIDDPSPLIEFSPRRRAIHIDGINRDAYDTVEKKEMLAEALASPPPDGWTSFPLELDFPT